MPKKRVTGTPNRSATRSAAQKAAQMKAAKASAAKRRKRGQPLSKSAMQHKVAFLADDLRPLNPETGRRAINTEKRKARKALDKKYGGASDYQRKDRQKSIAFDQATAEILQFYKDKNARKVKDRTKRRLGAYIK
ncbi:hypothetical protein SEA_AIKOY__9 [Mycobacterium phage Aikoy]|nr:hypothetical protein SEA_AIKOY__9 [Mycobacterium phage Aikoy]